MGSFRIALSPHPQAAGRGISGCAVWLDRDAQGRVFLRYELAASRDGLIVPHVVTPARADGLWRTTCFELFARVAGSAAYAEFNFSPSSQWAAYRFDAPRQGMADLALPRAPQIAVDALDTGPSLTVECTLPPPWGLAELDLGLSAVVQERDGSLSYWALAHPQGLPDFHHHDCFALKLPAPALS